MSAEGDVLKAAAALVDAFAREDLDVYFGCFAADATFLFHTTDHLITSVGDYRRVWSNWVREDDFHVLDAVSSDQRVDVFGPVAVFTHSVRTTVQANGNRSTQEERETIVFWDVGDGGWTAVHEHLSPRP